MRRSRRAFLGLAGGLPLVAAGCGGDAGSGASPAAESTNVPPGTQTRPPSSASAATATTSATTVPSPGRLTLLVTNSGDRTVSFIDITGGRTKVTTVEAGAAPHGLAVAAGRAYASTAEGVAVIDIAARRRVALVPYATRIDAVEFGEYRPGGWGITATPDGSRVFVGVSLRGRPSPVEVLDTAALTLSGVATAGVRPFQLLMSRDGRQVYCIDHDSFSLTVVDVQDYSTRQLPLDPLGRGAYDKPHYADYGPDGSLLMAYSGRLFQALDPVTGATREWPLTADTHQHGVALRPGSSELWVLGTGAAGGATKGPSLTRFDVASGAEQVMPLARPHERIAFSPDGGTAYLAGGYPLAGGWDGITVFEVGSGAVSEFGAGSLPMDIIVL